VRRPEQLEERGLPPFVSGEAERARQRRLGGAVALGAERREPIEDHRCRPPAVQALDESIGHQPADGDGVDQGGR